MNYASEAESKVSGEALKRFLGQKCAVLCCRFQYRGVLTEIGKDYIILADARAVEVSGPCNGAAPPTEDPIGSSVIIMLGSIEIVYQPNWCMASLSGD